MPDPTSVFNKESPEDQTGQQENSTNLFSDQLAAIKNDEGEQKYSSVEEALKGAQNAQEYIPTLKAEKDALQEKVNSLSADLEKRDSVEDVVARLMSSQKAEGEPVSEQASTNQLTEKEVMGIIKSFTETNELESKKASNEVLVSDGLKSKFGDKAGDMLLAKAQELNTSVASLQVLSQDNPSLVLSLFGETAATTHTPNISTTSTPPNKRYAEEHPAQSLLRGGPKVSESFNDVKNAVYARLGVDS